LENSTATPVVVNFFTTENGAGKKGTKIRGNTMPRRLIFLVPVSVASAGDLLKCPCTDRRLELGLKIMVTFPMGRFMIKFQETLYHKELDIWAVIDGDDIFSL
jgi:hypothetical protein